MRKEHIKRLSTFQRPKWSSKDYIYYSLFFRDLKNVFDHNIKEGDRVLDIGCGNKPYETYIRSLTKCKEKDFYLGCDVVQSSENKVDVLCEATDIPELSEQYDVIICTQVIEHVFEHQKVLEEAWRLLKPGGRCIVSSNFVWENHEAPYDFYRFTEDCFKTLLTTKNFEIKESKTQGGKWAMLGQLIIQVVAQKSRSKNWFVKTFRYVFNGGVVVFCNMIFPCLDKHFHDSSKFAMNYIFVGKKVENHN
jgi:ubiquinone/menaquinone biosynthesis C-methylase UbiE